MERDIDGKYICPHNNECRCDIPECHKCGWNPEVAERRLTKIKEELALPEKKYKIPFTGYCEVWARTAEEAAAKVDKDTDNMFFVEYEFGDPVCLGKEEEDELG